MIYRGITLIELLLALLIGGLLLFQGVPAFQQLIQQHHTTARVNALLGVIRFARETAVTQRRWIALCPAAGGACANTTAWHQGILVFADLNRDGTRDSREPVLARMATLDEGETLTWRSFRNRRFLQFRQAGYTNFQNGSFHYCPASRDPAFGKVIIVNIQGRAVPSVDANGDGVDEMANGNPLRC